MNHTAYRHPPAQQWYCRRRAGFPRLVESLVRNADATPLSPVASGNQVLALLPIAFVSYGTNLPDTWRQACVYVGRMGEKPSELPVVQPTKYQRVINLKTAKQLGIEVPLTLLSRAGEVIE